MPSAIVAPPPEPCELSADARTPDAPAILILDGRTALYLRRALMAARRDWDAYERRFRRWATRSSRDIPLDARIEELATELMLLGWLRTAADELDTQLDAAGVRR